MNVLELTDFLVKSVIIDVDNVSIKEFEDDENIIIEIIVSEDDMGALIGKGGNVINSIRSVINAIGSAKNMKRVIINIEAI